MASIDQNSFLTRRSWPLLALVLILHGVLLTFALVNQSYLTDDSIQYLTLSENLTSHGVWSQSFLAPYVPDLQRTPGYPVLLALTGNSIPLLLILQHLMVLLSGWVLFKILTLLFSVRVGRWGTWAWLLQPYPILMASLVLSEVPFILAFLLGMWGLLHFRKRLNMSALMAGGIALGAATYIRPVAMPVMIVLLIVASLWAFSKKSFLSFGLGLLLIPLLLMPWMLRNQAVSGQLNFNSMGDMALIHGRLGGLAAHREGKGNNEATLFQMGDSLAMGEKGLQGYRTYYTEKQSHETELYRGGVFGTTLSYYMRHPISGLIFQVKSWGNMARGVGYGWSLQLTKSPGLSFGLALLQGLLNLAMFFGVVFAVWKWRRRPGGMGWIAIAVVLILLVSGAAWADGRYRMVLDPLLVIMGGVGLETFLRKQSAASSLDQ